MSFNPFTWNNSQPQPTQNISNGQVTLLNNINFLGDFSGVNFPGWIQLPNGLQLQWGNTGALALSSKTSIVFTNIGLKAFTTNLFIVIPVIKSDTLTSTQRTIQISNLGFSNLGFTIVSTDALSLGCNFLAIGN